MGPPRVGSRGSSKFSDTHFVQLKGALCEWDNGIDDCTKGQFGDASGYAVSDERSPKV